MVVRQQPQQLQNLQVIKMVNQRAAINLIRRVFTNCKWILPIKMALLHMQIRKEILNRSLWSMIQTAASPMVVVGMIHKAAHFQQILLQQEKSAMDSVSIIIRMQPIQKVRINLNLSSVTLNSMHWILITW